MASKAGNGGDDGSHVLCCSVPSAMSLTMSMDNEIRNFVELSIHGGQT